MTFSFTSYIYIAIAKKHLPRISTINTPLTSRNLQNPTFTNDHFHHQLGDSPKELFSTSCQNSHYLTLTYQKTSTSTQNIKTHSHSIHRLIPISLRNAFLVTFLQSLNKLYPSLLRKNFELRAQTQNLSPMPSEMGPGTWGPQINFLKILAIFKKVFTFAPLNFKKQN